MKLKKFIDDVKTVIGEESRIMRLKRQIGQKQALNRARKGGGVAGLSGAASAGYRKPNYK